MKSGTIKAVNIEFLQKLKQNHRHVKSLSRTWYLQLTSSLDCLVTCDLTIYDIKFDISYLTKGEHFSLITGSFWVQFGLG